MSKRRPVDLEAVRTAGANLCRLAPKHPELTVPPSEANRRGWEETLEEAMRTELLT